MQIKQLLETIKITYDQDMAYIYDIDEHFDRLCKSIFDINLPLPKGVYDVDSFAMLIQNQIKNAAQYYFKKTTQFIRTSSKEILSRKSSQGELFKLRLIYNHDAKFTIDIEPYTRDLTKEWKIRLLSKEEFSIDSQDEKFKFKFLPRLDFSQYLIPNSEYDEVIWTNEKDEICEGSFTNVFFQDESGQFHTPYLEANILDGVMRAKVIKATEAIERSIKADELSSFNKKVFLSNTMIGLKEVNLS